MSNGHLPLSDVNNQKGGSIHNLYYRFYYLRNLCPLTCDNNDNWGYYYTATQTYLKILCVISILCHLCLEIARIPPRNNSNDASPQFFICFHSPELPKLKNLLFAVHICCLRNSALFFAQFPGTPDKSQIRILFS